MTGLAITGLVFGGVALIGLVCIIYIAIVAKGFEH